MNDATLKRRVEHAGCLVENFETNSRMIEHVAFQNESDFPLQIPMNSQNNCVYFKGQKKDVPNKNLSHETNSQSVKVMVSAILTRFGVTRPLFVHKNDLKPMLKITVNILKQNIFQPLIRSVPKKF